MDFIDLYGEMKFRTALTEDCSLPFLVEVDGTPMIVWFTFSLSEQDNEITATVHDICETADGQNVFDYPVVLSQNIAFDENEDAPQLMSKTAYLTALDGIFQNFSSLLMAQLLKEAVHKAMLTVYELVKNYYKNHLKDKNDNTRGNQEENGQDNPLENE